MPGTIVDALVVELLLDAARFVTGTKQSTDALKKMGDTGDRTSKSLSAGGELVTRSWSKARTEFLALIGLITAGKALDVFVKDTVTSNAALGRLAHNLGMTTQELGAWETAARGVGGTAEGMASSLGSIVSQFQTIEGRQTLGRLFAQLGVGLTDEKTGKLRDLSDVMLDLSQQFSTMDPARAMTFGKALGFDPGTINLLEQGPAALRRMMQEFRRFAPTEKDAHAAQELQGDWNLLTQQAESFGRTILTDVEPRIHDMLSELSGWIDKNKDWLTDDITSDLDKLATELGKIDWNSLAKGAEEFGRHVHEDIQEVLGLIGKIGKLLDLINGSDDPSAPWYERKVKPTDPLPLPMQVPLPGLDPGGMPQIGANRRPSLPTGEQATREREAMSYFTSQGWTPAQAAGIVAGIKAESGFDETAVGDSGLAHGLGQWHPDRQAKIFLGTGIDVRSAGFRDQLKAKQWELTHTEAAAGARLRSVNDPALAGAVDSRYDERPGATENARINAAFNRGQMASDIYARNRMLAPDPSVDTARYGDLARQAMTPAPAAASGSQITVENMVVNVQAPDAKAAAREVQSTLSPAKVMAATANSGLR